MKKFLFTLLFAVIFTACAIGFSACENGSIVADTRKSQIVNIYNTYVAYAEENGETPLSYEEWLLSIKGENGKDGKDGIDGVDGKDGKDGVSIRNKKS